VAGVGHVEVGRVRDATVRAPAEVLAQPVQVRGRRPPVIEGGDGGRGRLQ
jgi:hypothetical protein